MDRLNKQSKRTILTTQAIQPGNEFMKTRLSIWQKTSLLALAIFCLAIPAVAAPIQLVTTIDPAVAPPASGGGNSTSGVKFRPYRVNLGFDASNHFSRTCR
jgi:hypothetical protein